ncbi:MAG TPA: FAD:protein FMN transferase [Candidatus Methylomirabilis sp.]|nr:FAD:protein FMN transferase [Candidatus Methylomirabilis sp.]
MTRACDSVRRARPLLGTFVDVAASGGPRRVLEAAIESAFDAIAEIHRLMSVHVRTSDVSRLNRDAATRAVCVHPSTYRVLEMARDLHRRSAGTFDVAIAPAMEAHGLFPASAEVRRRGPHVICGGESIELLSGQRVRFHDPGVRIDLGGIAKGFAVDRALDALRRHGASQGLVNAGGDLAAFGPEVQTVHLRDPRDPSRVLCRIALRDGALASTGGRLDPSVTAHAGAVPVIDPRRGRPVDGIAGATVRASSCLVADALTKVVVVGGESALGVLDHYGASALLVARDGSLRVTSDWPEARRHAA